MAAQDYTLRARLCPRNMRVVIVGAGVSGLTTAVSILHQAKGLGFSPEVLVLDCAERPGGKMWSEREAGFVVEHGPNGFLDGKPEALELAHSLGLEQSLIRASPFAKKRFIVRNGRLCKLPESPQAFLASRLLSFRGKIRVLLEPFSRPPKDDDETLAAFAQRRLGKEALDFLIDPMVSGVFAGDPAKLSLKAAFPRIYELEQSYGGLFKALWRLRKTRRGGPAGPAGTLTSFRGGVRTLIETLTQILGHRLVLSTPVKRIECSREGYSVVPETGGARYQAIAVVLACPAYEAAKILDPLSPDIAHELSSIYYAPISVVATAFNRRDVPHPLDGFGFLVPGRESRPILGTLWDSSVFEGRAPEGFVLLRSMVGGAKAPELASLPERDLIELVLAELKSLLGVKARPERTWVYYHNQGIPQYNKGHVERVNSIFSALALLPGIFLCSNAYRGIGLNDCVREAQITAKGVLDFLQRKGGAK